MVIEMAGGSAKFGSRLAVFIDARPAKAVVGMPVIFGEIEVVLDERSSSKRVIADAVAAHPRVQKRKRAKKKQ